jgi:hypothetical protein
VITFTPGPWRVERGANSHLFDGIVCAGDEGIAFVDINDDGPSPNARLIAAAPALYEALVYAVSWIEELPRKNASHAMRDDHLQELCAALAAAKGDA